MRRGFWLVTLVAACGGGGAPGDLGGVCDGSTPDMATADAAGGADLAGCTPTALTATGASGSEELSLAVDDAWMYWVDTRAAMPGVYRAPKAGGAETQIGDVVPGALAYGLAVDAAALYEADAAGGVRARDKATGTWTTLRAPSPCVVPRELVADGSDVYVLENHDAACGGTQQIRAVSDGRLVAEQPYMGRLRADGAWLYFVDAVNATVSRVRKSGGAIEPLVTAGLTEPTLLWVADGSVYIGDTKVGTIFTAPITGGAATAIWTHPADTDRSLHAIVAGGGRVWVGWDDRLAVMNSDGSGFMQLGDHLGVQREGLALDATHLYVASGALYRICR